MKVLNQTRGAILARQAVVADTFFPRMLGLLNRESLAEGEALVITRCQSIHMFFMRFPIDVIFVGKQNRVVGLIEHIKPFRLSPVFFASSYVVELKAGTIASTETLVGDCISLEE